MITAPPSVVAIHPSPADLDHRPYPASVTDQEACHGAPSQMTTTTTTTMMMMMMQEELDLQAQLQQGADYASTNAAHDDDDDEPLSSISSPSSSFQAALASSASSASSSASASSASSASSSSSSRSADGIIGRLLGEGCCFDHHLEYHDHPPAAAIAAASSSSSFSSLAPISLQKDYISDVNPDHTSGLLFMQYALNHIGP
jgi:hypothetical protein